MKFVGDFGDRYDVFVAHTQQGIPCARHLSEILRGGQCKVFLDLDSMEAGDSWDIKIPACLQRSKVILLLITKDWSESPYFREEVIRSIALERNQPSNYHVLTILVDAIPVGELPYGTLTKQHIHVMGEDYPNALVQHVYSILSMEVSVEKPVFEHELHHYPTGPMVPSLSIPRDLVRTYADLIPAAHCRDVIDEADALRLEADPGPETTIVQHRELLIPEYTPTYNYWSMAFNTAGLHGPRMVAALVMAGPKPEQMSDVTRLKRDALLETLRGWR
ncbi:MAG: toll/interleukin-1 receptor domain-containing protein [Armatimonadetes bacterium]|nr:toll/interleukin-1 receptor domain-containing protein [Armatimonadota bacterium]